jgi:hypothetical protein
MRVSNFVRPESLFSIHGGVSDEQFEKFMDGFFPTSRGRSQAVPAKPAPSPNAKLTAAVASEFKKLGGDKKAASLDPHPAGIRKFAASIKLPQDSSGGYTSRTAEDKGDGSESEFESVLDPGLAKFAAGIRLPASK